MNRLTFAAIVVFACTRVFAADWPQWGGSDSRNFASDEKNIPASFSVGPRRLDGKFDLSACRNIKWIARLGNQTYGNPTVANGRVFVGTNGELGSRVSAADKMIREGGAVLCLDEGTGRQLWQLTIPRLMSNDKMFNFDNMSLGVCSSPTVDGDRVYLVSNRCDVLCLDAETGRRRWTYDTQSPIWSSTFAADGKVYLGTERGELLVWAAAKEMKLLSKIALDNRIYTTPIVANGVLYLTTRTHLYAIAATGK